MNQAHLHSDNMENVRERLENTIEQSSVETMYDGEDCFITVTQKNYETMNESKWSFCVDFGTGKVQMLEPTEDEESFRNDNEVFGIIKNFLNGGSSREKRMNRPDYDRGEPIKITGKGNKIGNSRKLIKSSNKTPYEEGKSAWGFFKSFGTKPENPYETKSYKEGNSDKCKEWNKGFNDAKNKHYNINNSHKPIKSGSRQSLMPRYNSEGKVWSDSGEEYVWERVKHKNGDTYHWDDVNELYWNDNGDESDYLMITTDEGLPRNCTPIKNSRKPIKSANILKEHPSYELKGKSPDGRYGVYRDKKNGMWYLMDEFFGVYEDKASEKDEYYFQLNVSDWIDRYDVELENPEQYVVEKEGPFNKCIGFNGDTDITLWKGKDGVYTLDYGSFLKTKRKDIADKWIEKYNLDTTDEERLDQLTKEGIGLVPWGLPLVEDKDQTNWNKRLADIILPPRGYNR